MMELTGTDNFFEIFITAVVGYAALVAILRVSGNRTLSKMNSFDFVITVSLGSAFATGVLQEKVSLFEVVFFFALVVTLQFIVTYLSVRSKLVDRLVKSEPILVFLNGKFLNDAMQRARVTDDEILSAIRDQGFAEIEKVSAVILESNGQLAAIGNPTERPPLPSKSLT